MAGGLNTNQSPALASKVVRTVTVGTYILVVRYFSFNQVTKYPDRIFLKFREPFYINVGRLSQITLVSFPLHYSLDLTTVQSEILTETLAFRNLASYI